MYKQEDSNEKTDFYFSCSVSIIGENTSSPVVYMTTDISPEGLMAIYETLGAEPDGRVAVKLSTGENGSNYLRPELIGDLVQALIGFWEC